MAPRGGLAAGLLFVLPGAFVVLALSMIYAAFGNLPLVEALFLGIKSAVLVIVVEALLRIGRRALKGAEHWAIAALAFLAIFFLALPFPADRPGRGAVRILRAAAQRRRSPAATVQGRVSPPGPCGRSRSGSPSGSCRWALLALASSAAIMS